MQNGGAPAGDGEAVDAIATAELAGLRYVNDDRPGITRRRAGRGFSYRAPDGSAIRDRRRLAQLKALAIPPAKVAGEEFTVNDFRTWGASVLATGLLGEIGASDSDRETTRRQNAAIRIVAHDLGNTLAVCRASYIHPTVLETFQAGRLDETRLEAEGRTEGLRETEESLLRLLGGRLPKWRRGR